MNTNWNNQENNSPSEDERKGNGSCGVNKNLTNSKDDKDDDTSPMSYVERRDLDSACCNSSILNSFFDHVLQILASINQSYMIICFLSVSQFIRKISNWKGN